MGAGCIVNITEYVSNRQIAKRNGRSGRFQGHQGWLLGEGDFWRGKMSVRILVVDDNAGVRGGLRLLLQEHADWEICGEAGDGIEAIEKFRQLKPDLLVVDVSMPRMSGLDAAQEILKFSPETLILLYTSYLTDQLIDLAHKAGIRGTVSKDALDLVVVGLETLLRGDEFSSAPN